LNPIISTITSKHFSEMAFPQLIIVPNIQESYFMRAFEKHLNNFQFDCKSPTGNVSKENCMKCSRFIQNYLSNTLMDKMTELFATYIKEYQLQVTSSVCQKYDNKERTILTKMVGKYDLNTMAEKLGQAAAKSALNGGAYKEAINALEEQMTDVESNATCHGLLDGESLDKLAFFYVFTLMYAPRRYPLPLGSLSTSVSMTSEEVIDLANDMKLSFNGIAVQDIYGLVNDNKYCCPMDTVCVPCPADKIESVQEWTSRPIRMDSLFNIMQHGMIDVVERGSNVPLLMDNAFDSMNKDCMLNGEDIIQPHLVWHCQINDMPLKGCFGFELVPVDNGFGYKLVLDREYTTEASDKSFHGLGANDEITLYIYEKDQFYQ